MNLKYENDEFLPNRFRDEDEEKEVLVKDLSRDEGQFIAKGQTIKKISFNTAVSTLINTTINRNILGFPYVIFQLGVPLGMTLFIIAGVLSWFSSSIARKAKNLSHHASYTSIAKECFGRPGQVLTWILVVLHPIGRSTSYFIILLTTTQKFLFAFFPSCDPELDSQSFMCRRPVLAVIAGLLILPFNSGTFSRLRIPSHMKIGSVIIFALVIISYSLYAVISGIKGVDLRIPPNGEKPASAIDITLSMMYAFNYLTNQFSIYKQMEDTSDAKIRKAVVSNIVFAVTIYILIGFFGHLASGSNTQKNLLNNFYREDLGDVLYVIMTVSFLFNLIVSIPATYFGARNTIYQTVARRIVREKDKDSLLEQIENSDEISKATRGETIGYYTVVVLTTLIVVIVGMLAPGADDAFEVTGYITSNGIFFLLPLAFYNSLLHKEKRYEVLSITVLAFSVAALAFTINSVIKNTCEQMKNFNRSVTI